MAELETTAAVDVDTEANIDNPADNTPAETGNAEIARLRAEMAKQKAALDKATSEAASMKKQLRAKQSAEEAAAEEAREAAEAQAKELAELRKRFAVAETSKKVLAFVNDEETANTVAEYLYGAEDVDAALTALTKAWTTREKALRLEYGKITAPGVGSSDGPTITKEQLEAMNYTQRSKFASEHPDEYNKLMGR